MGDSAVAAVLRRRWSLTVLCVATGLAALGYFLCALPPGLGQSGLLLFELKTGEFLQAGGWLLAAGVAFAGATRRQRDVVPRRAGSGLGADRGYLFALGAGLLLVGAGPAAAGVGLFGFQPAKDGFSVSDPSVFSNVGMPSALVGGTVIACTVCLLVARNVGLHRGGLLGLGAGVLIGFFGVTVVWGSDRAARHPGLLSLVIGAGIAAGSVIVLEVTAPKAQGTSARRPHYTWIWAISGLALFVAVLPYAAISQLPYLGVGPPFLTMADVAFGLTLGSVGMTLFTLAAPQRQKSADLVVAGMGLLLAMSGIVATGVLVQMDAGPAGIYRRSALQLADITAAGGFVLVAVAAGLRAGRQRRPAHPVVTATLGNVT